MKKNLFVLLCAATMSMSASAQKIATNKVPASITTAFKSKFPSATHIVWEKENADYEANFKVNGKEMSASFDNSGNWLETETELKVADLPAAVQQILKKDFANYKVNEASQIESVKNGNSYEAEIAKGKETFDVLFASDGKVISKTKKEKEKDEKKD